MEVNKIFSKIVMIKEINYLTFGVAVSRAGLNEREAPGKVVTARPHKHLAQLRSVSHALVSTLQSTGQIVKTDTIWPHAFQRQLRVTLQVVHMWLSCSNRKLYHKNRSFCYRDTHHPTIIFFRLSDHLHCPNRPFTYVLRKVLFTLSRRSKRSPFTKNVLNEISRKSNLNRIT